MGPQLRGREENLFHRPADATLAKDGVRPLLWHPPHTRLPQILHVLGLLCLVLVGAGPTVTFPPAISTAIDLALSGNQVPPDSK